MGCKWLEAKRAIERDIVVGNISAGAQIPTIEQLVIKYGIGRTTAQRVLDELEKDGLIMRKPGKGCYVRPFVKERVRGKREAEAKDGIIQSVSSALDIGIDAKEIEKTVAETVRTWKRQTQGR